MVLGSRICMGLSTHLLTAIVLSPLSLLGTAILHTKLTNMNRLLTARKSEQIFQADWIAPITSRVSETCYLHLTLAPHSIFQMVKLP